MIRISDCFSLDSDLSKIKLEKASDEMPFDKEIKRKEKVRIFSRDALRNNKNEKKDKKNIVKNIVKLFMSWLGKKSENAECVVVLE